MRYAVELIFDGLGNGRMPVTVQIGPDGGIRVDVFLPVHVAQDRALPGLDDDRLLGHPVLHLCEWMPEMPVIFLCRWTHVSWERHSCRESVGNPSSHAQSISFW